MKFYNKFRIEVDEKYSGIKWVTSTTHSLQKKVGNEIIFDIINNTWKYQSTNPKDWALYLKSIGLLKLTDNQTINDEGKIVEKTSEQKIQDGIININDYKLSLKELKEKTINKNVESKIINGFYSSVTGKKIKYQTSLTDQFEISQIKAANVDFKIKVYDDNNESTRVFHTAEQINNLYVEFFNWLTVIKLTGDTKKEYLKNNYLLMSLSDLQNFDTSV